MGLEKSIEHGKEHRKPYKGGKRVSYHCRNHGGKRHKKRNPWQCDWCLGNRINKYLRDEKVSAEEIKRYKEGK